MSKTAGLAALLVIFSGHAALCQDDSTRMRSLTVTGAQPASPPAGLSQSADSAAADTAGAAKTTTSGSQHATAHTAHTSSKGKTGGTSGAPGASGAGAARAAGAGGAGAAGAGAAADAYGRDRWGDNRWRDDRWRDDGWRDRPGGGATGANAGLPAGFNGAGLPNAAKAQGALPAQGAAAGMLNGGGYERDYWDRDRDYRRPFYSDNFNVPDAGGFNQSDIGKMISGQGPPTGR